MAEKSKEFSIIIRGKNEAHWLKILLKSIKSQNFTDYEIIFCDNNSSDETRHLLKKYKVNKILNIDSYTPGESLNKGVVASSGKYIIILSSHCIPVNNSWLIEYKKFFEKHKEIVACYGKQLPLPGTSTKDILDLNIIFKDQPIFSKDSDIYFNNANACYRSNYLKMNLFNPKLTNIEDRIWAIKSIKNKKKLAYTASSEVYHIHGIHQHNDNSLRSEKTSEILRKFYDYKWKKCDFIKKDYHNFGLIINARREKNPRILIKKINNFLKKKLLDKHFNKIFILSSLKIDKKKLIKNNIKFVKLNDTLGDDLKKIYIQNIKSWTNINYVLYFNISFNLNLMQVKKLIKYSCENTVESATLAEKYYGNFEVIYKNGSVIKSLSLEDRADKPWLKIMHWMRGSILIPYMLKSRQLVNEKTNSVYLN